MSTPALAPVASSNVATMPTANAPTHWDRHGNKYMIGGAFAVGVGVGYAAAYYFSGSDDEAVVVPPSASKAGKAEAAAA